LKKIATLGIVSLVLVSCSTAANSQESAVVGAKTDSEPVHSSVFDVALEMQEEQSLALALEKAAAQEILDQVNQIRIKENQWVTLENQRLLIEGTVEALVGYSGQTRYVFSGSTPQGWDCSGLVKWFYEQLDYEIPHSATKQSTLGVRVFEPKPGDIVAIRDAGRKNFHHTAIYIGNNEIIHAGWRSGNRTEILSLDSNYFKNSEIKFVRIIKSN
jgi:cell wall-associated NlpC family hydrolase